MDEIFKTVLIMSGLGFCVIGLLLLLKPITAEKFPANWQYCVWVAVLLCMLIPTWKLIPQREASRLIQTPDVQAVQTLPNKTAAPETIINDRVPLEYREITLATFHKKIRILDMIAFIWCGGACIFLTVVLTNYTVFLYRKRKYAVDVINNVALNRVKSELGINRRIKVRMSPDIKTPLLAGMVFPIVYLPCTDISEDHLRLIFLHELTHYKRKDLIIKWVSVVVNAIHWFNPLAYMLTSNVGEACEVSCDMAVTKNMNEDEQKRYMKTILELV